MKESSKKEQIKSLNEFLGKVKQEFKEIIKTGSYNVRLIYKLKPIYVPIEADLETQRINPSITQELTIVMKAKLKN